jgi:hypothetical protein
MMPNIWADPIGQCVALQGAVDVFLGQTLTLAKKLDDATGLLVKFQSREFPEAVRIRFERLVSARAKVRQEYVGGTFFEFWKLGAEEQKSLRGDVVALYKACLLDIGQNPDWHDIAYPANEYQRKPC